MSPIPCSHCGYNFMRHTIDPEAPRLCNSCNIREKMRTKGTKMNTDTVGILIQCPIQTQIEIEEYCINNGTDFTKYFLWLHENFNSKALLGGNFSTVDHSEIIIDPKELTQGQPDFVVQKKKGYKK
jgi:hypothetical protein